MPMRVVPIKCTIVHRNSLPGNALGSRFQEILKARCLGHTRSTYQNTFHGGIQDAERDASASPLLHSASLRLIKHLEAA